MTKNPQWIRLNLDEILNGPEACLPLAVEGLLKRISDYTSLLGSVPDDPGKLRRLVRADPDEFDAAWPEAKAYLQPDGQGGLVHPRGLLARTEALAYSQVQSERRKAKGRKPSNHGETVVPPPSNRGETVVKPSTTTEHSEHTVQSEQADIALIHRAFAETVGAVDDGVATKLLRECRTRRADATAEELVHFTRLKASQLSPRARNPVGILLDGVPKYFEGSAQSLQDLRRRQSEPDRESSTWGAGTRLACEVFPD